MFEIFSIAGAFGLLGFVLGIIQMQVKNLRYIFFLDIPVSICWAIHFFLLGAYAGAAVVTLAIARSVSKIIFPDKIYKIIIIGIMLAVIVFGLYFYQNASSTLPIIANIIICYGSITNCRKNYTEKYAFALILWAFYGFMNNSLFGVLDSVLALCSCILGKARHEGWFNQKTIFTNYIKKAKIYPVFLQN